MATLGFHSRSHETPKRPNAQTPNSASRWKLSLITVAFILPALFYACTKTEVNEISGTPQVAVDPRPLIKEFLSGVGHQVWAEDRSADEISVDSAIWYVEAALNWNLTATDRSFNDLRTDTLLITLPIVNGQANASAVEEVYGPLQYTVMGYTNEFQHVVIVDVQQAGASANQTILRILSFIGSGYEREAPPSSTYASNDWRKHNYGGSVPSAACVCGPQPAPVVRCMDKEIEYRINAANPAPPFPFVFINVETWNVGLAATNLALKRYRYDDPFLQNPSDPGWDGCNETLTYSWWQFYSCESICAAPNRQAYWTNSTWSAVTKIRQYNCPTKYFKVCVMGSDWWVQQGILEPHWLHTCAFTYGNLVAK